MPNGLSLLLRAHPDITHIFVDVFDTALLRTTTPEIQRFYEIAARMRAALKNKGLTLVPATRDIFMARVLGWRAAYATAPINQGCREPSLDDILRLSCIALGLNPDLAPALRQAEMDYEATVLRPNKSLLRALAAAQKEGKRVLFVSDMYLLEEDVHNLLRRIAPDFTWDGGHVSCMTGLSKRERGLLFHHVLDLEVCPPKKALHIGDNPHSDYAMPRQVGLEALFLPRFLLWRWIMKMRTRLFLLYLHMTGFAVNA